MNTLFIGKNVLFLPEVESTNTYAINLLRNVNVVDGTIIYTNNQTQGKGQRGAVWTSEIGQNITLSVILQPRFLDINKSFYLSKITALACYDVLTEILDSSHYDIKIKWPNDILVNKKKIGGVLIENNLSGSAIHHAVIGIGLNVNQEYFGDLNSIATSMKLQKNIDFDTALILESICSKLEKWYFKLKENKLDYIHSNYLSHLFGLNQIHHFIDNSGHSLYAEIMNVEENGKLLVKNAHNDFLSFDIKEVKMSM
jgi:BirA family biotin operon repressor/biotin-[acetyl-CoA-carboxylase] ligase